MRKILLFPCFILTIIYAGAFINFPAVETTKQFHHRLNKHPLGISIVLYRVNEADKIDDLSKLESQMDKSKSVNLYKITQDLGIIFMNTPDPYSDTAAIPYKMLFGTYVEKQTGDRMINGFVSTAEVRAICDWIIKHRIDSLEGFSEVYDSLSKEARQELEDIGADNKENLFNGYVQPLTRFYFAALKDKNSIVICGE